eukprot:15182651-Ditylum_brightwellii.AAC.1
MRSCSQIWMMIIRRRKAERTGKINREKGSMRAALLNEDQGRTYMMFFAAFLITICDLFILGWIIQVVTVVRTRLKEKRVDMEAPEVEVIVVDPEEEIIMVWEEILVVEATQEEDLLTICITHIRILNTKILMSSIIMTKLLKLDEIILHLALQGGHNTITFVRLRLGLLFPLTYTVGMIPPKREEMALIDGMVRAKGAADAVK